MNDKLPVLSGDEIIKALKRAGFNFVKQRGSHVKLKKKLNGKELIVIVPRHREVKRGVLLNILKQAEMKRKEFMEFL
jgi:predicted RNA binding protein YcfA (HicA-like mRNA interferase family)